MSTCMRACPRSGAGISSAPRDVTRGQRLGSMADSNDCGTLPALSGVSAEVLPDKDKIYFNDYSTLIQQQGMLQDTVRTSIYQFAILENGLDFAGKSVSDDCHDGHRRVDKVVFVDAYGLIGVRASCSFVFALGGA
eukprot:6198024-Pleurochrysis_carterae.AAC.3